MQVQHEVPIGWGNGWLLVDPRPYHNDNPSDFFIPTNEDQAALKVGDGVKLWFMPSLEDSPGERFWVQITHIDGDVLTGAVDNGPRHVPLKYRDVIRFRRHHILSIQPFDLGSRDPDHFREVAAVLGMFDHQPYPPTRAQREQMTTKVFELLERGPKITL